MLLAQSTANMEDVGFEAASFAARILVEQVCVHVCGGGGEELTVCCLHQGFSECGHPLTG